MIFYIATDTVGKKHVLTVEAEAKKIDKNYVTIDQPNDKASLKLLIQESFDKIYDLEQVVEYSPTHPSSDAAAEPLPTPAAVDPKTKCPKCSNTLKSAEDYVRVFDNIHKQEGMEKFILEEADWAMLGMIASSIAYRFERFAKTATPVDKDDGPTAA